MINQYGPDVLDDPMGALTKVKQTGSVLEYHKQFIRFCHLIEGLSMVHIISCFLAGLRDEIRQEVKKQKAQSIVEAYKMVCTEESILAINKRSYKSYSHKT